MGKEKEQATVTPLVDAKAPETPRMESIAFVQSMAQDGDYITVKVYLGNNKGLSASGKSEGVGYEALKCMTSQGQVTLALNAYIPVAKK